MKKEFEFLNEVEMDFSEYEECDLTEMERFKMKRNFKDRKKKRSLRTAYSTAACLAALLVFSQTSIAKAIVNQIISIGHSEVIVESEEDSITVFTVPDELIGQIFDENGNELTELTADQETIFNSDGEEICLFEEDGEYQIGLRNQYGSELDDLVIHFSDVEELKEKLSFNLKVPTYLPDGYELVDAYGLTNEEGIFSPDYAILVYGNGDKEFTIHERRDCEENAFVTGITDAKEKEFHGETAVYNDTEFMCTWDGTTVSVLGGRAISGDEFLKVAESME